MEESNCYMDSYFCQRKGKETSFYCIVSCSNTNTGIVPDAASDIKFSGKALLKYWNKADIDRLRTLLLIFVFHLHSIIMKNCVVLHIKQHMYV